MRLKGSSYFLIFLVLVGLFGIIQSLTFSRLQAIMLPLAMSSVIFVLAVIALSRELRSERRTPTAIEEEPGKEAKASIALRRFGSVASWVVGFALGIYLLGFLITTPVFVLAYLKKHGRGWLVSTAFAIAISALMYVMFEVGLKVPLYKGLVFGGR